MTHVTYVEITKELNKKNRDHALRIFITGLNAPLRDIIFSLNPQDLPDALAKAQELESNNQRAWFAQNFANERTKTNPSYSGNNFRFPSRNNTPKPEPMDVGPSASRVYNKNKSYNNYNARGQQNLGVETQNSRTPKRPRESTHSFRPQEKTQRVNNIDESHFLGEEGMSSLSYPFIRG